MVSNTLCVIVAHCGVLYTQVSKSGIKSDVQVEILTEGRWGAYCLVWSCKCEEKLTSYIYKSFLPFQQRHRLPQQYWKWVRVVRGWADVTSWMTSKKHYSLLTHFFGWLVTQGKIPSSNCWSLRLTRSTQWKRYNKDARKSKEVPRFFKGVDFLISRERGTPVVLTQMINVTLCVLNLQYMPDEQSWLVKDGTCTLDFNLNLMCF